MKLSLYVQYYGLLSYCNGAVSDLTLVCVSLMALKVVKILRSTHALSMVNSFYTVTHKKTLLVDLILYPSSFYGFYQLVQHKKTT